MATSVFGNPRANERLDRFTLRGRAKVDGQWKRFCLVHNTEKLARLADAASAEPRGRRPPNGLPVGPA